MDSHFSCLYFFVAGSRSAECSRTTYFSKQTLQLPTAVERISVFPLVTFYLNLSKSLSFALEDFGVQNGRNNRSSHASIIPGKDRTCFVSNSIVQLLGWTVSLLRSHLFLFQLCW